MDLSETDSWAGYLIRMKLTYDKQSEEVTDKNEDFSLLHKSMTPDVEEARSSQDNTRCDCRKGILTTLISLILVVLGKMHIMILS